MCVRSVHPLPFSHSLLLLLLLLLSLSLSSPPQLSSIERAPSRRAGDRCLPQRAHSSSAGVTA